MKTRPFPLNIALKSAIFATTKPQSEIAEAAGLNETLLSQIVRGWRRPTKTEREALALALAKPIDELFSSEACVD